MKYIKQSKFYTTRMQRFKAVWGELSVPYTLFLQEKKMRIVFEWMIWGNKLCLRGKRVNLYEWSFKKDEKLLMYNFSSPPHSSKIIPFHFFTLKSSSVPNLRISSISFLLRLDLPPILGWTTRWVNIIFFFATWVTRSSTVFLNNLTFLKMQQYNQKNPRKSVYCWVR